MKNNYVLIDYENVQPKNLDILNGHEFKILIFVGENQTKISFDLASAIQALGNNAEYVKISGNGPNALDFHIAFYIGQLAERDPNAYFHIISKDTGFDPLIKHLKGKKIFAQREKDLSEIPLLRISNATSVEDKIEAIVKSLAARGHSRPRKVKTLTNTINSLFMRTLEENELMSIIEQMKKRNLIAIENENVSYNSPISQPNRNQSSGSVSSKKTATSNLSGENIDCPTCKHSVGKTEGQFDFICQNCGTAFRY